MSSSSLPPSPVLATAARNSAYASLACLPVYSRRSGAAGQKGGGEEEDEVVDHERRDDGGNGPCPPGGEGEIDVGADRTRPLA